MVRTSGLTFGLSALVFGLASCATYRPEALRPSAEIKKLDERSPTSIATAHTDKAVADAKNKDDKKTVGLPGYHPEDGLDESELVVAALNFNPDLRSRRYVKAGIGSNSIFGMVRFQPQLKVGIDNATFGLSADSTVFYTLLVPNLRRAWHDENEARELQTQAEILVAECQVVLDTRRAHLAVLAAAERLRIAQEHHLRFIALTEEMRADNRSLLRDKILVEVAGQESSAQVQNMADALVDARRRLNLILGFAPDTQLHLNAIGRRLATDKLAAPPKNELDTLILNGRWELKVLEAEYRHAEYNYSQSIMGQYPRLNLAPLVTYDREKGTSVGLGGSVRLPWPEQAAEQAETSRVGRDRSRAVYVAKLHEMRSVAWDAYDRVERKWSDISIFAKDSIYKTDARREFALAWEHREIDLPSYLSIGARLDSDDFSRCDAERDYRIACIDLDYATGRLNVYTPAPAEQNVQ